MKIIGVIPARWGSSRFEGKVLADLNGQPMIRHVWERSRRAITLQEIIIACDDERVREAARSFSAPVVMTSSGCASGTDRIREAVQDIDADIVLNIQADEPLIDPSVIDAVARALTEKDDVPVATAIRRMHDPQDIQNPNIVKVVVDRNGLALYFSRAAIPFNREPAKEGWTPYFKHLGLYGYRRAFLLSFDKLPSSGLEQVEKLEQLRILEAGYRIKTVVTDTDTIGVDTPEDLQRVASLLSSRHA